MVINLVSRQGSHILHRFMLICDIYIYIVRMYACVFASKQMLYVYKDPSGKIGIFLLFSRMV